MLFEWHLGLLGYLMHVVPFKEKYRTKFPKCSSTRMELVVYEQLLLNQIFYTIHL